MLVDGGRTFSFLSEDYGSLPIYTEEPEVEANQKRQVGVHATKGGQQQLIMLKTNQKAGANVQIIVKKKKSKF